MKRRAALLTAILLMACPIGTASAGFLEDYYDAAGAMSSVTPAGVRESQSVRLATGGSFVVKTPRKDFTPFMLEAPSLKAGCGGIDLFLGAFSVPSREEFVGFLRSIGTALPGLAFQLALQGLSPDLSEMVSSYRDLILSMTRNVSDSCRAAETLLDATGASGYLSGLGLRAANALRTSGEADDQSEADRLTRTNGEKRIRSAPTRKDAGGSIVEAGELNLTWALLKGGKFGGTLDASYLEMMMTLAGTTIYRQSGSGESATIESRDIAGRDILWDLYGSIEDAHPADAKTLVCDEPERCLNPRLESSRPMNLTRAIYEAGLHYRKSLLSRNRAEVTEKELALLANISSIPLVHLIERSANPRLPELSLNLLGIFAEAAAYEAITNAAAGLLDEIRRTVESSSAKSANKVNAEHAAKIEARLKLVLEELHAQASRLDEAMQRAQSYAAMAEHIERSVYGRAAADAASALPVLGD